MGDAVQSYYNANTRIFLASELRRSRRRFLHRELAVPEDAFCASLDSESAGRSTTDGVHRVLGDALARAGVFSSSDPHILDLGCGVGGTLAWLAPSVQARLSGITLSEVQAAMARTRFLTDETPCTIATGSFEDQCSLSRLCTESPPRATYMIESFVHSSEPTAVFRALSGLVEPGAVLIVIDDFPAPALATRLRDAGARRMQTLVDDFRDGWHITTFAPSAEVAALVAPLGWQLERSHDLSPYVVTSRFRDHVARSSREFLRPLKGRNSYVDNVVGGGALQRLIRTRAVRYELLVFSYAPAAD